MPAGGPGRRRQQEQRRAEAGLDMKRRESSAGTRTVNPTESTPRTSPRISKSIMYFPNRSQNAVSSTPGQEPAAIGAEANMKLKAMGCDSRHMKSALENRHTAELWPRVRT